MEDLGFELDLEANFYLYERSISKDILVKECYKKSSQHNYTLQQIASWSRSSGLDIKLPEKYERRSNLSGLTFDIAAIGIVSSISSVT